MNDAAQPRRYLRNESGVLWLTGIAFAAIHIAASGRYGFHRDELLSYSNAIHLDWCYVVYPPLTAWLARAELAVFGTSLMGYRFLPAVAVGLVSVMAGLIAQALGGRRRAMLVSALAAGIAGPICFAGTFFSYMSFDILWWVAVAWATACLLRTGDRRWWVAIGAGVGLGLLTKYTILFLVAGLLVGMVLTPLRRDVGSKWFWYGVAVAIAMALPVILWQFQHHFVALDWMESIHKRDVSLGRADYFIPNQLWNVSNPVTVPLWFAGLWFLFATKLGKPFRMLGWMYAVPLILFVIAKGRDYYMAGAYPMLLGAGAAWGENWISTKSPGTQKSIMRSVWPSLAVGCLVTFALTLPIAPVGTTWWRVADGANQCFNSQLGWPELVATLAHVRDALPAEEHDGARVLASDEGSAGAVNMYGPAYGLKEAISGMNSNWLRGYGDRAPETVIAVGYKRSEVDEIFAKCEVAARLWNPYGIVNQTLKDREEIYVCRDIREPWPEFWKSNQYYG